MSLMWAGTSASAQEAYAALSEDNTVLTFYYDNNKASRNGMSVGPFTRESIWDMRVYEGVITTVVFDSSFAYYRPTSTAYWFYGLPVRSIIGIQNLHTDNVVDMSYMFCQCFDLTSLDLSNFNTSKVTNMSHMFYFCENLSSLNVSGFNTSNVTDMSEMFSICNSLTNLDVSNFNTSNVTDMGSMFNSCTSLTSLDVSNFNTGKVTNMKEMFYNCTKLTNLDVRNFNTSNVKDMEDMFSCCSYLTSLDVTNFNTSNVTSMCEMFYRCNSLTSLDVSNFDTYNVRGMWSMFFGCSGLTSLDVSNFNTENVKEMWYMFNGCTNLSTIYVSDGWSTESVTHGNGMFDGCTALIGGKGTEYDETKTGVSFAHVDGGESNPGYLTAKVMTVEITETGWATLYSDKGLNFSNVDGLTAYTATCDGKKVELTEVENVPANTGVVLKAKRGKYDIPVTIFPTITERGDLTGSASAATAWDAYSDRNQTMYILASSKGRKVRFVPCNSGSVVAGKAFLLVSATSTAKPMDVVLTNEVTGISNANVNGNDNLVPAKRIERGQLIIEKAGRKYNIAGQQK